MFLEETREGRSLDCDSLRASVALSRRESDWLADIACLHTQHVGVLQTRGGGGGGGYEGRGKYEERNI